MCHRPRGRHNGLSYFEIDNPNGFSNSGSQEGNLNWQGAWEALVQAFVPFGSDIYPLSEEELKKQPITAVMPDLPIGPGGAVKVVKYAKNARKIVVIGEDMTNRVIPYAKQINATWFKPTSTNPANWMKNQVQWIRRQITDPGTTIIDIGPKGTAPTSKYYMKELEMLQKWLGL